MLSWLMAHAIKDEAGPGHDDLPVDARTADL